MKFAIKVLFGALLLLAPGTLGCDDPPQDIMDGLAFGLDMGALVADHGVLYTVEREDFPGCIAASVAGTVARTGAGTLKALDGKVLEELPAIEVNLAPCAPLVGGFTPVAPEAVTQAAAELWREWGGKLTDRVVRYVEASGKLSCYHKENIAGLLRQFDAALPQIAENLGAPTGKVLIPAQALPPCQ